MTGIESLCDAVRRTAWDVHVFLGHGHMEKVYENALAHRLRKVGLRTETQFPLQVFDEDGTALGDYFADLVVEGLLVVELKACRDLAPEHAAQVLGYLRASRIKHGMLINFGSFRFQVRKFVL